jgi:putative acetyltransferase
MITVRQERLEDIDAVRHVNEQAFGRPQEAALVDLLRVQAQPFVSLVAVEDEQVVGHIFFSPVTIEGSNCVGRAMGLAPMGILPDYQRRGIGSLLVREGLLACQRTGFDVVVVLGHPDYYPRFGFMVASEEGLRCEYEVPDEAFMVAELRPGALSAIEGLVKYDEAFRAV